MLKILIPSSAGDLVDRITILEVKMRYITDLRKRKNIKTHLAELKKIHARLPRSHILPKLHKQLFEVNRQQWKLEDLVRKHLREKRADAVVRVVRRIHVSNDKRTTLKRRIDAHVGSHILEEKQYG